MSTQILATKLYIPSTRPELVTRPRLIEQLNEGLHRKLTLISTPAGFGKTTLVGEWVRAMGSATPPVAAAWLSLDERDNDPTRFLAYLVAALQTLAPSGAAAIAAPRSPAGNIGEGVLAALQSPQPPPTETILTALLNEITSFPEDFVLVLDDYHVIDAKPADASTEVDDVLTFLLEYLPPQMHLVIATREDPNLPLARLRAQGQLTELRVADLRFTPGEAATFLNQMMGLGLSASEVDSLETRTEGWIAGLQLAALSMRGREDVPAFIKAFAGDHRYIVDYLVEEVLQHQPARVRSFLLQTSILDRLNGPLCAAVTGQEGAEVLLQALERGNLFVVPLDDKRHWFRYHRLFADVLHAHLMEEQPDRVSTLHRRASEWYEHNTSPAEAVRHALAAEDFERAAGLVELAWSEMDRSRQSATWLGWVKALPDKLVRARPVLTVGYAWALLDRGKLEAGEARLQDAQRWLDLTADTSMPAEAPLADMVVADKAEFRALPATIAAARAFHALATGDVPGTVNYARRALDLLPAGDHLRRGTPDALLALASWTNGDLETADQSLADAMNSFQMAGNLLFAITGAFVLADIRTTLGRLRHAFDTYQQSLQLAAGQGKHVLWGTADLHTGLSELFRERNDLDAATEHLLRSKQLGEQAALPRWHFRWCLAQARVKEARGDLDGALDSLDEAERHYVRGPVPDVRPIAALRTWVWVAQGRLTEAVGWAREQGLSVDDDLSYLREFEHVTLAKVLVARYRRGRVKRHIHAAMGLLERLLKAAEQGGRMGIVIEILVLQALAHQAQGDIPLALAPLERALALAEPEGYVRIFVDKGEPMRLLLLDLRLCIEKQSHGEGRELITYVDSLLDAFARPSALAQEKISHRTNEVRDKSTLVEPLTQRELEVLQLIAQGLSNREISERLFLALSTVKGHNRKIYGKLQVQRRTEAVARARERGLL